MTYVRDPYSNKLVAFGSYSPPELKQPSHEVAIVAFVVSIVVAFAACGVVLIGRVI